MEVESQIRFLERTRQAALNESQEMVILGLGELDDLIRLLEKLGEGRKFGPALDLDQRCWG